MAAKLSIRNLQNGYVVTAGGVQEMEHRPNIVQPSVKNVKVNNSLQHWAGCIIVDVFSL